ncbi:MAG TPA: lycopene cyclase domain-containing protein [Saprospiraceae bacterium]|nr:lycopene cyclase domain-containing protein [Saprospiraceae bacterium]HMQ82208.1 lycopene cyclase domain-containing protein [Saprospiraceae bacterium]
MNYLRPLWIKLLIGLLLVLVGIQWGIHQPLPDQLSKDVPQVFLLPFLERPQTYFYLHLFTFIPVFLLSFDRNVHYYKQWRYLWPGILIMGALFILWDSFFTLSDVWGFNENYVSGVFFLHLPLEEWLFFLTVPFASVFIYECLNFYVKKDWLQPLQGTISLVLLLLFLLGGFLTWGRLYSSTTLLLAAALLAYLYFLQKSPWLGRFYFAFLFVLIPFLLVNGVLTGGYTNEPVVLYNPEEFMGIRITSVPLEDAVYGFTLLLGITAIYEWRKLTVDA